MVQHQFRSNLLYGVSCAVAVLGLILMLQVPRMTTASILSGRMLSVHLVMELFAIVIAVLVVVMSWHTIDIGGSKVSSTLISGFVVVAICDLLHALTYEGMPAFLTESSTKRAIFFWLMGRSVEVATLGLVAWRSTRRTSRNVALARGLLIAGAVVWFGSYQLNSFPETFVAGLGVTPFKARCEYVLCVVNVAVALLLARRASQSGESQYKMLALSSFMMALGELAFTSYVASSDFQNIFGHGYKLVAYGLLYQATFVANIRAPFYALKQSEARLRESETRMRRLSDNLPQCVVYQLVLEPGGKKRFTHLSEALERINGLKVADVLRDASLLYGQVHPEDAEILASAEQRSLESMQLFDVRVRIRRVDGVVRRMHLISAPRRTEVGLVMWDGIELDITESEEADQARRILEAQVRESQKMESLGTLASGIAHDFNNVLGAIIGNASLALDDLESGAKRETKQCIEQIQTAGLRARDLVRQILMFSRRQVPERFVQPLRPVIEEGLSLLRTTLPPQVLLDANFVDAPIHVLADKTQVEQIILNLCTNAWHAMGDVGGRIQISLDVVEISGEASALANLARGSYARLQIKDDGCGMDEVTCRRVFEPFFTTKPIGQGTGLGLSVVHGIALAHEGTISVRSSLGKGTTFEVLLPLVVCPAESAPTPLSSAIPVVGNGERILYLDDDEVMSLMVERLLERAGYSVECSRDPVAALDMLHQQPDAFDIVVTDFNMPVHSGLHVIRALASICPGLPVILTSGSVSDELRTGANQLGVYEVIEKQNTLEELAEAVDRTFRRKVNAFSAGGGVMQREMSPEQNRLCD